MRKYPIFYLLIGIIILIVPTTIYLCFLVPKLSEAYNVLMASAGVVGGAGMYGASKIPEKIKFGSIFKLAANSFSIFVVITLVQQFIWEIMGLVAVFIISFIIFKIMVEVWRNARTRKQARETATEVARAITQNS